MLIEMHCHTAEHSSCSSVAAVELVLQVHAKGLQGIVLTDHHYLWGAEELAELRVSAGVPDHFLILSGQEVTTAKLGDVLVYGAAESFAKGISLAELRARSPAAALVWAHPYRKERRPTAEQLGNPLLDGVEIFSSNQTVKENSRGLQDWHRLRFTAIAGTDTHGRSYAGIYPTQFDHPVRTITELATELRAGRCRPFFKEIPHAGANTQVTEVTIGTKGSVEARERLIIRTLATRAKWRSAERGFRIMAAVAEHGFDGGRYRVPRPLAEDPESMTLIEQGLRGKSLFDKILASPREDGRDYLELAARWLARLHDARLAVTPAEEFAEREERRLAGYLQRFEAIGHQQTRKAREILEAVREGEARLLAADPACLVQGHGDFHPKNVYVGQDNQDDRTTLFVAAIDFDSSLRLPPAFDVGCFVAQFRNQFFAHPEVREALPEELFLAAYRAERGAVEADFLHQVELFRARTNLSIAAYLIKLGLGESEDLWRVLVEAEQALMHS
jgi:hypothetical protein